MKELEDDDGLDLTYWQSFVYLPSSRKAIQSGRKWEEKGRTPDFFLAQNIPIDKRNKEKRQT